MLSTYAHVLRTPGARSFCAAGAILRMPISMMAMSTIVLVRAQYGNYTLAGVVGAVNVIAVSVCAPFLARWVDRFGQRTVMAPAAVVFFLGLTGMLVSSLLVAPSWILLLSSAVAGAAVGSPGALVRARWSAAVTDFNKLQTAYALEAAVDEFSFIVGPILATVLGTAVHPGAGMVLMLVSLAVGSFWFLSLRDSEPKPVGRLRLASADVDASAAANALDSSDQLQTAGDAQTAPSASDAAAQVPTDSQTQTAANASDPDDQFQVTGHPHPQPQPPARHKSLLRNPVIVVLALTYVGAGAMFAANDLGDIAFTAEHGHPELAGVVTGAFALGSFTAALIYGARVWNRPLWKLFAIGVIALALGSSTFLLAHSIPVLTVATVITGLTIAPTMTNVNTIVTKVVPPARLTEGLTWMSTAMNLGVSIGAPAAGAITDLRGSRGAFELVIVFAWLMVALMLIGLPKLRKATAQNEGNRDPNEGNRETTS